MSKLKEYIEFYEKELEKLEKHKEGLLEIDKSTAYTDKKINHICDLLTILRNSTKTEELAEENREYKQAWWRIEQYIEENDIESLVEFLREAVEDKHE